jgi:hypothetical protein
MLSNHQMSPLPQTNITLKSDLGSVLIDLETSVAVAKGALLLLR